jgi:hypothetical protein
MQRREQSIGRTLRGVTGHSRRLINRAVSLWFRCSEAYGRVCRASLRRANHSQDGDHSLSMIDVPASLLLFRYNLNVVAQPGHR